MSLRLLKDYHLYRYRIYTSLFLDKSIIFYIIDIAKNNYETNLSKRDYR